MKLFFIVPVAPAWRCGAAPEAQSLDCSWPDVYFPQQISLRGLKSAAHKERRNQVISYLQSHWCVLCLIALEAVRQ